MSKGECAGCFYEEWDGEYGTIQSCGHPDDITFREEGIEVGDKLYPWGECPLWTEINEEEIPVVPY